VQLDTGSEVLTRYFPDENSSGNGKGFSGFEVQLDTGSEIVTRYFPDESSSPSSLCPSQEVRVKKSEPTCPPPEPACPPPKPTCPPKPSCPPKAEPTCPQKPSCPPKVEPSCPPKPACPPKKECEEEKSWLEKLIETEPAKCCDLGPVPYDACQAERFFDKEDPRPKKCEKETPKCGVETQSKNPFAEWFANQDPCPGKPDPPPHPSCAAACGRESAPEAPPPPYPCCDSPSAPTPFPVSNDTAMPSLLPATPETRSDAAKSVGSSEKMTQTRVEKPKKRKKKSLGETAIGKFFTRNFCAKSDD